MLKLVFGGLFNLLVCIILLKVMFKSGVIILRYFFFKILLNVILMEIVFIFIGVLVNLLVLNVMCFLFEILREWKEYILGVLVKVLIMLVFVIIIEVFWLILIFCLLFSFLVK